MAPSCGRCRYLDMFNRKRRIVVVAFLLFVCLYLLTQGGPDDRDGHGSNTDLLLALGMQGSARDKHGHRFKYLGIDGKWIPVSESPGMGDIDTESSKTIPERHGYRLDMPSRKDASRGQSLLIDKLLNQQVNGFFLDIGAGDGETNSITLFFERWRQWSGVLIEPDEEKYEFIQSKNRQAHAWKTCVSTTHMRYFRDLRPCVPVTQVLTSLERNAIDLLTIKVKGHSYDVIKTIDLSKFKVKVFCVEFVHEGERNVEYNHVTQHLLQRGYVIKNILIEKHLRKMDVIYMAT